ncbi:MAG: phosphoenolpyruvate synthase [Chloroflexi bacterium]|nr:phosphoenolpyruvate synthase [Chloroflexota bacterium]
MNVVDSADLVVPLSERSVPAAQAGGKGAPLTTLAAAGLPVPAGFICTTMAYSRYVAGCGLAGFITGVTGGIDANDLDAWERASRQIRARFDEGELPAEIADPIRHAYHGLGGPTEPVAVRSSATAEDLPGLSFAGQQDTYLDVRDDASVLDAVRRCWSSLWTARAMQYRRRMGVDESASGMAVVVQVMVPAEVSGVLFTANPGTGERGEIVVNASYGLGEAVASGLVTPDTYVVDRATLTARLTTIGEKALMVVPAEDDQGTAVRSVPVSQRETAALSEALLRDVARLGLLTEEHLGGAPLDVEWAIADGRVWLLQARPITNLPPAPPHDVRWEPPSPGSAWIRRQVVEHMPEPLAPLFDELYVREGLERATDAVVSAFGISRGLDAIIDRPIFTTIDGYAYSRANVKLGWREVPLFVQMYVRALLHLSSQAIPYWRDETLPAYLAATERWKRVDPAAATDAELLEGIRALARADARYWFGASLAIGIAKITDGLLDSFLHSAVRSRRLTSGQFLRGFPSRSQDAEVELEALAARIGANEALRAQVEAAPPGHLLDLLANTPDGAEILTGLQTYLDRYGHLIYTLDFSQPTQADDPRAMLVSLQALVRQPGQDARASQAALAQDRERLTRATLRALAPLKRWVFRRLLGWAQRFGPYREEALFYVGAGWPTLRRLARELGQRLVRAGTLDDPDDIYYLESSEIVAASTARAAGTPRPDLAERARERRALREARKQLHPPGMVPPGYRFKLGPFDLSDRLAQRNNPSEGPVLRGFAVSPGKVTATARVILSPAEFASMTPGAILVCPTTTPAWTPLFGQARGLVTDIGGILAHGSIVAREYGIPAVMGTGTATQRIVSGQTIAVDGDTGTVTLLEDDAVGG